MARLMAVSMMLLALLVAVALVAEPVAAYTKRDYANYADYVANKPVDASTVGAAGTLETTGTGTQVQPAAVASRTIVVDQSGKGNYKTVQQAINAVPNNNKNRVIIVIRPGVYRCASIPMYYSFMMIRTLKYMSSDFGPPSLCWSSCELS